jgi:hypothetical protein
MVGFRRRIIPTTLFGLLGSFEILLGAAGFVGYSIYAIRVINVSDSLAARYGETSVGYAACLLGGILWLISAVSWWRGRWRWATLTGLLGLVATIAGFSFVEQGLRR